MGMIVNRVGAGLVAVVAVVVMAGCSTDADGNMTVTINKDDAYKVGCQAVDVAVDGGSFAGDATTKSLQVLHDSKTLGEEAQRWLGSAISVLQAGSVDDIPADTRKLVVDGCADQGYPLENLTS